MRLGSEVLGYGEGGHDRAVVERISLDFVKNLKGVGERFGNVGEKFVHFLLGLHPFLFGVAHAVLVGEIGVSAHAYQAVVRLGVGFVYEVNVVCGNDLNSELLSYSYKLGIHYLLIFEHRAVAARSIGGVALQLNIVVVAEGLLPPGNLFFGLLYLSGLYKAWNLSTQTCRAYYKSITMGRELFFVGSRVGIEAFCPCLRHEFYKIMVSFFIFG